MTGLFAGCGKTPDTPVEADQSSPFAIYRKEDGATIKIGDTREYVAQLVGPDELFIGEIVEERIERVQYWDNELLSFDFSLDSGTVVAMRVKDPEWKIFNGLTAGADAKEIASKYPEEVLHQYKETDDIWISYDEDGNPIEYSENCPAIVRFSFEDKRTKQIVIQDNAIRDGSVF